MDFDLLLPATLPAARLAPDSPPRYQRHLPETTLLCKIVEQYYPAFLTHLESEGRSLPDHLQ